ncbi:MAG: transglycosylase SLT domain-containing protein, partial [Colwelliaceae bacterium]|nr:transglycosylase SLT domain-containing protein [Colwelliaceae bacterium]
VIETESSFNPFAVSPSNAYGLMQIIPKTAGKDVYQRILKRPGIPSKQLLFTANENIEIGTAYLHILQQQYLKKIINPLSRHYSVISAYNGGAGNVFKTFSRNRENAPTVINKLSPNQVYNKLTKKHPRSESRNYLTKVTAAEKRYSR